MKINVLDHGYVEFIEAWGTGRDGIMSDPGGIVDQDFEVGIIEAARQSTQASFRGWEPPRCTCDPPFIRDPENFEHKPSCARVQNPGDKKLLQFLYKNNHSTPFEFAGMVIEVQAPIFVFREWHRHRTQSYNEMSARYAPLPDLHYEPDPAVIIERGRAATDNKQAGGVTEFRESAVYAWLAHLADHYRAAEKLYRSALCSGIPKELARLSMPVGHYSRMRAQATLRNWLAFLTLRMDHKTQWETRQYAEAVAKIVADQFPRTYHLFWMES